MKGDPTINDIPLFQKAPNVHCHAVGESTIENIDLTIPVSVFCKHVGSRSTDALRELAKRDPTINDIPFSQKARNVHCHSVGASPIEDIDLASLLSAFCIHAGVAQPMLSESQ